MTVDYAASCRSVYFILASIGNLISAAGSGRPEVLKVEILGRDVEAYGLKAPRLDNLQRCMDPGFRHHVQLVGRRICVANNLQYTQTTQHFTSADSFYFMPDRRSGKNLPHTTSVFSTEVRAMI